MYLTKKCLFCDKEGKIMKRFLSLILIAYFFTPVYASCNIDSDMPCTAGITSEVHQTIIDRIDPSPLENLQKPSTVVNNLPSPTNPFAKPSMNDYNSNCQFGICLPQVHSPVNNIIKGN